MKEDLHLLKDCVKMNVTIGMPMQELVSRGPGVSSYNLFFERPADIIVRGYCSIPKG